MLFTQINGKSFSFFAHAIPDDAKVRPVPGSIQSKFSCEL